MKMVLTRIVARYAAGALVGYGFISQDVGGSIATDPDVLVAIGAVIGIATEAAYAFAKRLGYTT